MFSYPDSAVVIDTVNGYVVLGGFCGNYPILRRGDTVYIAYSGGYGNYIGEDAALFMRYSVDNGLTWSSRVRISPWDSLGGDEATLFFDRQGRLHCVWRQAIPGSYYPWFVVHSVFDNGVWSFPETISPSMTAASGYSSVVVDSSGVIHVVYDDQVSSGNYDIFYTRYEGGSWTVPQDLSQDPYDSAFPALAIDSRQRLHVVWRRRSGYPYPIIYRRYENGVWTPQEIISDTFYGGRAGIAIDFNDRVHVVFGGLYGKIYHTVLIKDRWTVPELIYQDSDSFYIPLTGIGVDSNNILYLVWTQWEETGGYSDIYYMTYDGNSWVGPLNLTRDTFSSLYPHIPRYISSRGVDLGWTSFVRTDSMSGYFEIVYMRLRSGVIGVREGVGFVKKHNKFRNIFYEGVNLGGCFEVFDILGRRVRNVRSLRSGKYFIRGDRVKRSFILIR